MNKRVAAAIWAAAVTASVTGCGHAAGGAGTSPANPGSPAASVSPSPAAASPAAASPAASPSPAPGDIAIICVSGGDGAVLTINTASGKTSNVIPPWPAFSGQVEQFPTTYGSVSWKPTDDMYYARTGNDPCLGWKWNPLHTRIIGTASIPNGNTVPASISIAHNTLTLLAPVRQSKGFAAAPKNTVLDAVFGPDGSAWWLAKVPGSARDVVLHHGTQTYNVRFPSDVDLQQGVSISFGKGGAWVLKASTGYQSIWATSAGISQKKPMRPLRPVQSHNISLGKLKRLLPQTQYTILYGFYSRDRSQIAFLATPPNGSPQLFTVPVSGGTPTQVTHGSDLQYYSAAAGEFVYFGPESG